NPVVAAAPWRPRPVAPAPDYAACVGPARTAVAHVAGRHRLTAAEAEDLHGELWVRLLANEGRTLRNFQRMARIETYLVAVATNLLIDRQRQRDGKWRPTARSVRAGVGAIEIERLVVRDGVAPDAAIERVARCRPASERPALARFGQSIVSRVRRSEVGPDGRP